MVATLTASPRSTEIPRAVAGTRPDVAFRHRATSHRAASDRAASDRAASDRAASDRAVYRRRRVVAAGAAVALLLLVLIALQAALGRSDGGPLTTIGSVGGAQPASAQLYVVRPGDTLWSIALASGARGDIRPLVDRLSAEVHDRPLQPGQQILIP